MSNLGPKLSASAHDAEPSRRPSNGAQSDFLFVPTTSSRSKVDPNTVSYTSGKPQLQEKCGRSSPLGIALLDTSVSRHVGDVPKRVFPESRSSSIIDDEEDSIEDFYLGTQGALSDRKKTKKPAPPPLNLGDSISPFDREVPFILSMSPRPSFIIDQNPDLSGERPYAKLDTPSPKEKPPTPSIVITPSEDTHMKPYIATTGSISRRLRQPSSVYSQAVTPSMLNRSPPTNPPPIPQHYLNTGPTLSGQNTNAKVPHNESIDRPGSAYTTFEEEEADADEHYDANEETPLTAEARATRFSIETVLPTPRRSKGWWNLLSTPILGRFSTGSGTRSLSFTDNSPELSRKHRSPSSTIGPWSPQATVSSPGSLRQQPYSARLEPVGEAAEYYDPQNNFESPVIPRELSGPEGRKSVSTQDSLKTVSIPESRNMRWPGFHNDDEDSLKSPISPEVTTQKHIKNVETHEIHTRHITHRKIEEDVTSPLSPSPVIGIASLGHFQPARQVDAKSPSLNSRKPASPPQPTLLPPPSFIERSRMRAEPSPALSTNSAPDVPNPFYNSPHGVAKIQQAPLSTTQTPPGPRKQPPPPLAISNEKMAPVFPPPPRDASTASTKKTTTATSHEKSQQASRSRANRTPERPLPGFLKRMDSGARWILAIMVLAIAVFITLVLVVVLSNTKKSQDKMPVQAAWVSVANLPPIPTGISTIAKTSIMSPVSGCVQPQEMWSCRPSDNDTEPNFRIEIRLNYENTSDSNTTLVEQSSLNKRHHSSFSPTVLAAHLVKRARQLVTRDELSSAYFTPNPAPPTIDEQQFLGQTSDEIRGALQGELTPFYISFLPTTTVPLPTRRLKPRQDSVQTSTLPAPTSTSTPLSTQSNPYSNLTTLIPEPPTTQNGSSKPTTLFPFPHAQPVRLYDRGLDTEHYGFYTYFDRSLLVRLPSNDSDTTLSNAPIGEANALCTFSQTRFRVQIFTKRPRSLLPSPPNSPTLNSTLQLSNGTNSANDFVRPGSFPLPITISLDRHGGDPARKAVYCYQVSDSGIVNTENKLVWPEDRGFGGTIVAPAVSPFAKDERVSLADGGVGGIDGGSGGCGCSYTNFRS